MGMVLIYGIIFLVIFLAIGIALFLYSRRKKSKFGLTISILMILFVVSFLLTNTLDEYSISKKDIVSDFKYINLELRDDFIIIKNEVTGMPERLQETEIQISQKDKDRIINEILNSANFKSFANEKELINDSTTKQFGVTEEIYNFKYPEFYSRKTYAKIDNYPTRLLVNVYVKDNIIKYQRIED